MRRICTCYAANCTLSVLSGGEYDADWGMVSMEILIRYFRSLLKTNSLTLEVLFAHFRRKSTRCVRHQDVRLYFHRFVSVLHGFDRVVQYV